MARQSKQMDDFQWIMGVVAVESVLTAGSREVARVYVQSDRFDGAVARLQTLAREAQVPVERVPAATIVAHFPDEGHSGVIARVGPRRTLPLDDLFTATDPVIVFLDGVEDPYNFGQAVRSLYAAGIDGLILRPRNWLSAAATAIRASAGATEFMPTAVAEPAEALAALRSRGIPLAVAVAHNARPMHEVDLTGPLCLAIGGEKRGVGRALLNEADLRVAIPYGRDFAHDLGTTGATTALAFEVLRQRLARRR
jgi:23S rRNA (guanosine2251-2'-O)-methyltransferase